MSRQHCSDERRFLIGGFVLGGLSAPDRETLAAHLAECAACRAEIDANAAIPGLLRRAPLASWRAEVAAEGGAAPALAPAPGPDSAPALAPAPAPGSDSAPAPDSAPARDSAPALAPVPAPDSAGRLRRAGRSRPAHAHRFGTSDRRRVLTRNLGGLAAGVLLFGAGWGGATLSADGGPASRPTLTSAPTGTTTTPGTGDRVIARAVLLTGSGQDGGEVTLVTKSWGTALGLVARGGPSSGRFVLRVVGRDGVQETACTWAATGRPELRVTGASSLVAEDIVRIEIVPEAGGAALSSGPPIRT